MMLLAVVLRPSVRLLEERILDDRHRRSIAILLVDVEEGRTTNERGAEISFMMS